MKTGFIEESNTSLRVQRGIFLITALVFLGVGSNRMKMRFF
jgi:hypothetical protein